MQLSDFYDLCSNVRSSDSDKKKIWDWHHDNQRSKIRTVIALCMFSSYHFMDYEGEGEMYDLEIALKLIGKKSRLHYMNAHGLKSGQKNQFLNDLTLCLTEVLKDHRRSSEYPTDKYCDLFNDVQNDIEQGTVWDGGSQDISSLISEENSRFLTAPVVDENNEIVRYELNGGYQCLLDGEQSTDEVYVHTFMDYALFTLDHKSVGYSDINKIKTTYKRLGSRLRSAAEDLDDSSSSVINRIIRMSESIDFIEDGGKYPIVHASGKKDIILAVGSICTMDTMMGSNSIGDVRYSDVDDTNLTAIYCKYNSTYKDKPLIKIRSTGKKEDLKDVITQIVGIYGDRLKYIMIGGLNVTAQMMIEELKTDVPLIYFDEMFIKDKKMANVQDMFRKLDLIDGA